MCIYPCTSLLHENIIYVQVSICNVYCVLMLYTYHMKRGMQPVYIMYITTYCHNYCKIIRTINQFKFTLWNIVIQCDCDSLWYIVIHCDTLWYIAIHCDTLRYTVIHCDTLWYIVHCCDTLRYIVIHCETVWYIVTKHCDMPWYTVIHCDALSYIMIHCDTLWYIVIHYTCSDWASVWGGGAEFVWWLRVWSSMLLWYFQW